MSDPVMPELSTVSWTASATGLNFHDLAEGSGDACANGNNATVHYSGWLESGSLFDSSKTRGTPFTVEGVGQAPVIDGWNEGLVGMKPGGRRLLKIPSSLGYGDMGIDGVIPGGATLIFEVELLSVS
ncbi:MAG: FKBP-type peptidyl-prolyl cis-trans isomerase [Acidobacteriota bacterium]